MIIQEGSIRRRQCHGNILYVEHVQLFSRQLVVAEDSNELLFQGHLLQELGGTRGLCVHPVIIVRLAPQINGLAEAGHAPLVRAPHRGRSRGRRTCSGTCACPTAAVLISGSRPPLSLIDHLSTKLFRPPVAHNMHSVKRCSARYAVQLAIYPR